jgi:hypothetical protein
MAQTTSGARCASARNGQSRSVTALGGFVLLGTWLGRGGMRQREAGASRFPPGLIFGHFLLAAAGLVLWIVYLATDTEALSWVAFAMLLVVALLGFTMAARWLQGRQVAVAATAGTGAAVPAEQHFPSRWWCCTGCSPPPPWCWCC